MTDSTQQSPQWQQSIEKLLLENLHENKRRRRWGIFFKSIFALYIFIFFLLLIMPTIKLSSKLSRPHASVVDIRGMIMPNTNNSADNVVAGLAKAFKDKNALGVILRINSPGGTPVQASNIYNNIMRLRHQYPHKKIYAVCSDVCASAAYYIASATDEIYANPSSLVGSIGVLLNGFGFVDTMKKLGVTRRLITSGNEKGFLDPFSPLRPQDEAYAKTMLNSVHAQFIRDVEKGRGDRLKKNPQLFSGLVWTGIQAKQLGLIDHFGSAGYVMRTVLKTKYAINYTKKPGLFKRISKGVGASFATGLMSMFEGNALN